MALPAQAAARSARARWPKRRRICSKHFGRLDPPLGTVLRLRQGKVDLPMDGGPDVLRAAALWDEANDGRLRGASTATAS